MKTGSGPKVDETAIHAEQLRISYEQTTTAALGGICAVAMFAWIFATAVDASTLMIWSLMHVLVYLARCGLSVAFDRRVDEESIAGWSVAHISGILVTASLWGSIWVLFVPVADQVYMFVAMLWALGLGASAIGAYAVHLPTTLAFYLPVSIPAFVYLLLSGGRINATVALGLLVNAIISLGAMSRINRAMLDSIRSNVALAREIDRRQEVEDQLRELSRRDGLTGLANRAHFDETLESEWRRALRDERPVSLILIDIDDFKSFNDTRGHLEGDACLVQVADVLRSALKRPGDLAARYGGDELVVLLPNTDTDSACELGDTLRARIESMAIPRDGSRVPESGIVTLSLGVSTLLPNADLTATDLLERADKALYRAKSAGRNRLELTADTVPSD